MANQPRLGSESFWEMFALAMEGWLASCQSCVEHYYFQSWKNAIAFLDSCAAGGLVKKISLLDLRGDIGPRPFPTLWQQLYDQAIYISAPVFRKENLDAARKRIEGTKNAVYGAFHLYHEVLGGDDQAIHAAYMAAVETGNILRHTDLARQRKNVALSPVAELRLLHDGRKVKLRDEKLSPGELEKRATEETTKYVLGFSGKKAAPAVSDRVEELEEFVLDFLADRYDLAKFAQEGHKLPSNYRLRLLPVIRELACYLYGTLREVGEDEAQKFAASVREKIDEACVRAAGNENYALALRELRQDFDDFIVAGRRPVFVPTHGSNRLIFLPPHGSSHLGPGAIA